jgi:hypothetical protein
MFNRGPFAFHNREGRAGRRPGYDVFITTNCYSQRFHLLSCRGEGRRRGGSKLRCSNCYARMTRKVTSSSSKRRRRKRRRRRGKEEREKDKDKEKRKAAGDGEGKGARKADGEEQEHAMEKE